MGGAPKGCKQHNCVWLAVQSPIHPLATCESDHWTSCRFSESGENKSCLLQNIILSFGVIYKNRL